MKPLLLAALIVSLFSCSKETEEAVVVHPQMTYTNLANRVVNITTPAGIDISGDGTSDVWFEIWHTRDEAQTRDFHRFTMASGEHSKLLVNAGNASPIIAQGSPLAITGVTGYEWTAPAQVELAKRTLVRNTAAPTWEGTWKEVQRKYLAVQVTKNGAVYNGWIELSFDTAGEKIILYRSGISQEPGKAIVAGQ